MKENHVNCTKRRPKIYEARRAGRARRGVGGVRRDGGGHHRISEKETSTARSAAAGGPAFFGLASGLGASGLGAPDLSPLAPPVAASLPAETPRSHSLMMPPPSADESRMLPACAREKVRAALGCGGGRAEGRRRRPGGAHLELALRVPAWRARAHPADSRWAWWARAHREGASRAAVCAHDCCCRPARELRRVAQPAAADAERSKMSAAHGKDVARRARSSARAPCAHIARHVKHVAA